MSAAAMASRLPSGKILPVYLCKRMEDTIQFEKGLCCCLWWDMQTVLIPQKQWLSLLYTLGHINKLYTYSRSLPGETKPLVMIDTLFPGWEVHGCPVPMCKNQGN